MSSELLLTKVLCGQCKRDHGVQVIFSRLSLFGVLNKLALFVLVSWILFRGAWSKTPSGLSLEHFWSEAGCFERLAKGGQGPGKLCSAISSPAAILWISGRGLIPGIVKTSSVLLKHSTRACSSYSVVDSFIYSRPTVANTCSYQAPRTVMNLGFPRNYLGRITMSQTCQLNFGAVALQSLLWQLEISISLGFLCFFRVNTCRRKGIL